jgi:predicted tellurium resistance membrane protein TerC
VIVTLTAPLFSAFGQDFSWRDLILIAGGLFLVWKATKEIHHRVDPDPAPNMFDRRQASVGFAAAMGQIVMLDLVFSIDSIITAVGMTPHVPIMVVAVIVAVLVMLVAATPLSNFINANPTVVMLALGFLLMIGMVLIADGFGVHVPKGYVYASMAFSVTVEGLNILARRARRRQAVASPGGEGTRGG